MTDAELDRLIDALNDGQLDPDAATDPEAADLLALARDLKRFREPDWPDDGFPERLAGRLAAELTATAAVADSSPLHDLPPSPPNGRDPAQLDASVLPLASPIRRRWLPEAVKILAAVAVVALVGGLLAAVLGGHVEQAGIGNSGVLATPPPALVVAQYDNLTFEQTRQLAPFHLVRPQWVPSYLVSEGLVVDSVAPLVNVNGTPATAPPTRAFIHQVTMNYSSADPAQPYSVTIQEIRGPQTAIYPGNPTSTPLTIAGHTISQVVWGSGGRNVTTYAWEDQGTGIRLNADIIDPLTPQDVEHMIASMLEPDIATPTSGITPAVALPTPSTVEYRGITFTQAQQRVPFYVARPKWIPPPLEDHGITAHADFSSPVHHGIQYIIWTFGPHDSSQHGYVQVVEDGNGPANPPQGSGIGTASTVTIGGQSVTKQPFTDQNSSGAMYHWTSQGTGFLLTAHISGALTEQDAEHMIASMLP